MDAGPLECPALRHLCAKCRRDAEPASVRYVDVDHPAVQQEALRLSSESAARVYRKFGNVARTVVILKATPAPVLSSRGACPRDPPPLAATRIKRADRCLLRVCSALSSAPLRNGSGRGHEGCDYGWR